MPVTSHPQSPTAPGKIALGITEIPPPKQTASDKLLRWLKGINATIEQEKAPLGKLSLYQIDLAVRRSYHIGLSRYVYDYPLTARAVALYLADRLTTESPETICSRFKAPLTSIVSACARIESQMSTDTVLQNRIEALINELTS